LASSSGSWTRPHTRNVRPTRDSASSRFAGGPVAGLALGVLLIGLLDYAIELPQ
jgi:hypothetical protein